MKELTNIQKKANARNHLFRQIHGCSLSVFANRALNENAITGEEYAVLSGIISNLEYLKNKQFENSKKVGLNPKRRCCICKGIARWKEVDYGLLYCNKCMKAIQGNSESAYVYFNPINPNE